MIKRIVSSILLLILCLSFTACSSFFDRMLEQTTEKYREYTSSPVEFIVGRENETSYYLYQNHKYISDSDLFYTPGGIVHSQKDKLVELGDGFLEEYYSYTKDNPLYIISSSKGDFVYLREDYIFETDNLIIENSNIIFNISNVIDKDSKVEYDGYCSKYLSLTSESLPYLKCGAELISKNGKWFLHTVIWPKASYQITDDFVKILVNNNFIPS